MHDIFDQLTYKNLAQEPIPTPRRIEFNVSDGVFDSSIVGTIFFNLTNNHPLVLQCPSSNSLVYTEGSDELLIAQQLVLSDDDQDHIITRASVLISNNQTGDSITVDSNLLGSLTLVSSTSSKLQIIGIDNSLHYQVM